MISDKLSVGPPQLHGVIDSLKVQNKYIFKDKKEFEGVLKNKDKEFRETSGGTNRKMSERKIDNNPKRLSEETEKDEKELQPTSNPMAFQQSRVEVVDLDKDPNSEDVVISEISVESANQKLELIGQEAQGEVHGAEMTGAEIIPLQDEGEALLQQVAKSSALTTEAALAANVDASTLVGEEVTNPFQANVFQALQQSQSELAALAKDSALTTKDLSEALETGMAEVKSEGLGQKLNAEQIHAQLTKSVEHVGQNPQNQQFAEQQFGQNFATNQSQEQTESVSTDAHEEFRLDDQSILKDSAVIQDGSPTNVLAPSSHTFQAASPMGVTGIDKPTNPVNLENTAEIVKQAEFLVKDGGGTATIRMTPEGMGTVDLRVTMNDGKVQVELNTADPQTKKLLQESISDLRSSLASHNFNLDHVKINNMSAMADLSQQNSNSQSFLNQQNSGQNQNWNQFEGQMQQQHQRQGNQAHDIDSRSSSFKPDSTLQADNRSQTSVAPKITRGYGMATKTLSSVNMVA